MQKLVRLVSKPVAFILLVSFSFNASGQNITPQMEKDFRVDARIKVSQAAQVTNTAVDAYEKSGPKAFVDSFGSLLNPEEKTFIIKKLSKLPPLPHLKMKDSKLIVYYKERTIAELESYDVAEGIFQAHSFKYIYNVNLDLIENLKNWELLDKKNKPNDKTYSFFLKNLLLPSAMADNLDVTKADNQEVPKKGILRKMGESYFNQKKEAAKEYFIEETKKTYKFLYGTFFKAYWSYSKHHNKDKHFPENALPKTGHVIDEMKDQEKATH